MERTTIALIALCLVLLLAQFFMSEGFFGSVNTVIDNCVDASGTALPCGSSGKCIDRTGAFATCSATAVINKCMDASGTPLPCGSSGNCIDLNDAIVPCGAAPAPAPAASWGAPLSLLPSGMGTYDAQFASLRDDIRQTIRNELAGAGVGAGASASTGTDESCADSPAAAQGSQFLQEVYGKDPNAYIKKDSSPCYGCSLP